MAEEDFIKKFVCINCPRGCELTVNTKTLEVKGNSCPRGEAYGKAEVTNPLRTVTSTVRIEGAETPRVSVRTDKPIPKGKMFELMDLLKHVDVKAPVKVGDIVIPHVLGTDANVIITKEMGRV